MRAARSTRNRGEALAVYTPINNVQPGHPVRTCYALHMRTQACCSSVTKTDDLMHTEIAYPQERSTSDMFQPRATQRLTTSVCICWLLRPV